MMDVYDCDYIERHMQLNMTQGSALWDRVERFGLPLVDDEAYYRTDKYDDQPTVTIELTLTGETQ